MRRIRMLSFTLLGSAVLLAGLVALASLPAAPSVHADSIIVLQPRTPLNGRFVSHDIWDQVESVWTCKIIRVDDTIFDACNYEDVFPLPEPPPWKRRLVDQGGRWVCVPTPVELSPIQAPFVKGLCLFADENQEFPNSFEPTAEQLEQSAQDQNRLMRGLLALDPAAAAQNPEQAYYLKSQKDAARRQIFGLATLNNVVNAAESSDDLTNRVMGIVRDRVTSRIHAEIDNLASRASDPADPNFREIPQPVPPPLDPVQADTWLSQADTDKINALLADLGEMIGLSRATLTALDRATGAQQAGELEWEQRQLRAAFGFDLHYADLVDRLPDRLSVLGDILARTGISTTVTAADIVLYQRTVISATFAPTFIQELTALGLTQDDIDETRIRIVTHSPDAAASLANGRFPDIFSDPEFARAAGELSAALRAGPVGAPHDLYLPAVVR